MEDNFDSKNSNDIQNESITSNPPLIQLPPPVVLKPLRSICKIDIANKLATGFLIKFFKGEKDFFCLMTNEHVITKDLIRRRKKISIYYDSESQLKEISLNPEER